MDPTKKLRKTLTQNIGLPPTATNKASSIVEQYVYEGPGTRNEPRGLTPKKLNTDVRPSMQGGTFPRNILGSDKNKTKGFESRFSVERKNGLADKDGIVIAEVNVSK